MTPLYAQNHNYSDFNVLAVDDIPINLILVQKMLMRFNFNLRTASSGQAALDAVAEKKPDLILLDLMMPGIDGFEVIRRLKENPE
ncbi:MAG: response regulator, partial [Bacteroidales bacterium]|nr:response regulator [Bacteroidales bacterium]